MIENIDLKKYKKVNIQKTNEALQNFLQKCQKENFRVYFFISTFFVVVQSKKIITLYETAALQKIFKEIYMYVE